MLQYKQSNGKIESNRKSAIRPHFDRAFPVRLFFMEVNNMEQNNTRVAVIGIIVEKPESVSALNELLSSYRDSIIGRMGLPYPKKDINCITVVVDAEQDEINTLCVKIGKLDGITSKAAFSNV